MHIITINLKKRGHEFEEDQKGTWEGLKEGKGKGEVL